MNKVSIKAAFIICIIILSAALMSCNVGKEYKNTGEVIQLENCEITIQEIKQYKTMEYVSPAEGNVFIGIKFNYKNISETELESTSLPVINLQTGEGTSYKVNYDASLVYSIIQSVDYSIMKDPLEAQASRDDCEVYEVAKTDLENTEKEIVIKIDKTNYYVKVDFTQNNTDQNTTQTTDQTQQDKK